MSESSTKRRVKKDAAPPFPPPEGSCQFYIRKKNRYCKMVPAKELRFCGEHIMSENTEELPIKKIRIPCPIDPTHTCFQNQLKKHVKICNSRLEDQPPGFVRNVNAGPDNVEIPEKISINDLKPLELKAFIEKVESLSDALCMDNVEVDYREHPAMKEELARTDLSEDGALKHARQQSSILSHMESANLLCDGRCFVEMGAGRGHVNHWIQRALGNDTNSQFVLVDRQGVRYKMDSKHRDDSEGPKFHRLRMDIQHLKLSEVPEICGRQFPVVIVSKHLCGAATDLTLRCAFDSMTTNDTTSTNFPFAKGSKDDDDNVVIRNCNEHADDVKKKKNDDDDATTVVVVIGVVIALCCHHRVDYRSYVGHPFLTSSGFEPREFWLLRSLSSWATCGFDRKKTEEEEEEEEQRRRDEKKEEENKEEEKKEVTDDETKVETSLVVVPSDDPPQEPSETTMENCKSGSEEDFKKDWDWYYRMSVEEKGRIGRRCKRLLDRGRISFIESMRPDDRVELRKYVDEATSLENILLLTYPK